MNDTPAIRAEETAKETEPYTPPELTVVGELGAVTKGTYSKPHSDDSDAGGYWAP
ncbi:MAG: hypothetical protein WCF33_25405 [Pseudonocardiaceae bacterium]